MSDPNADVDIIVVGSGAAALSAALTAAHGGAQVLVLEKSDKVGGTSAMSGAGTWIPANHLARRAGIDDSEEDALTYLRATAPDGWAKSEDALWQSFVAAAPRALELIDELTPLEFELTPEPDPMCEYDGASRGGRMMSPKVLRRALAGPFASRIRPSTLPHIFTYVEAHELGPYKQPIKVGLKLWRELLHRLLTGARGQGTALVTGLIHGCLEQGVRIETRSEVSQLMSDDLGRIGGVVVEQNGEARQLSARRGVILATGGFEWDSALLMEHFPGPLDRIGSPRTNTGDGQRMAVEVGAALAHMDQANVYATLPTIYEGEVHGMPMTFHGPRHLIVVNRDGQRIGSELDYNLGERVDARDPDTGEPLNLPCWMVADQQYLKNSGMFRWFARKQPGWLRRAPTIPALAEKIGVDPRALAETVERYNGFADQGQDADFHRGESIWERYKSGGTPEGAPVNLGRIDAAPYIAVPLNRSILATKGGPRTDANGQVLREDGSAIAGLYCAGVAMANPIGTRSVGAGTTIGPCMTWGYICAQHLLRTNVVALQSGSQSANSKTL